MEAGCSFQMLGSHYSMTQYHNPEDRILIYTAMKTHNSAINSLYKVMFPTHKWAVKGHSANTHLSYSILCALPFWLFYRSRLLHSLFITNIVQRNFSTSITESICVNFIAVHIIWKYTETFTCARAHTRTHTRTHTRAHTHVHVGLHIFNLLQWTWILTVEETKLNLQIFA
jgi:hypothetical protein